MGAQAATKRYLTKIEKTDAYARKAVQRPFPNTQEETFMSAPNVPQPNSGATHSYMQPSSPTFAYISDGEDVSLLADQELYAEVMECGVPLLSAFEYMARGYQKGNPLAVLAKGIATAACDAPKAAVLTGIGKRPAPLNFLFCLAAPSGIGKGTSLDAPIVVADPLSGYVKVSPASGEALINAFYEDVPAPDGRGTEKVRHFAPVWATWGEIDAFAAKSGGSSSTLDATLRSLFTGEDAGDTSISRLKSGFGCTIEGGTYRFVMFVGAQPDHAGGFLDDETGGTLQRLLWLPVLDEDAPTKAADIRAYRPLLASLLGVPATSVRFSPPTLSVWGPRAGVTLDPSIEDEMLERRGRILSGEPVDPLDTHRDNLRVRIAAVFAGWRAGIGNPAVIDDAAWWWASCLVELSKRTRKECEEAFDRERQKKAKIRGKDDADRYVARDAEIKEIEYQRIRKLSDKIAVIVKESGTINMSTIKGRSTNKYNRDLFDQATDLLIVNGDIVADRSGRTITYTWAGK